MVRRVLEWSRTGSPTRHRGLAEPLTCCVTLDAASRLWSSREGLAWKTPEVPLVSGMRENTSEGSEAGMNKQVPRCREWDETGGNRVETSEVRWGSRLEEGWVMMGQRVAAGRSEMRIGHETEGTVTASSLGLSISCHSWVTLERVPRALDKKLASYGGKK